jgi:DNA repair exonuclease SbcCD nuclease subunit
MASFRFLHAADLHLDSPLMGLSSRAPDFAARVAQASRLALDNLVNAAIEEQCRFVVIAGDVFDGQLRDVASGLFFVSRLKRLTEAGIEVFMILGNHDAENRFMKKLLWPDGVHLFEARKAGTRRIEALDVAVHGQSFPDRAVTENIAAAYPPPVAGLFNIGILHTSADGRAYEHATYAPCTVEQLVRHGYDYWALGHIHQRTVLSEDPPVLFSGNLQGRHINEAGEKGATLVEVIDGRIADLRALALDTIRWQELIVSVDGIDDPAHVRLALRDALTDAATTAGDRALALRVTLAGTTPLHDRLHLDAPQWREDIETLAGETVWIERFAVGTHPPDRPAQLDASLAGEIEAEVAGFEAADIDALMSTRLAALTEKFPQAAGREAFTTRVKEETPARAADLARAILREHGGDDAAR